MNTLAIKTSSVGKKIFVELAIGCGFGCRKNTQINQKVAEKSDGESERKEGIEVSQNNF